MSHVFLRKAQAEGLVTLARQFLGEKFTLSVHQTADGHQWEVKTWGYPDGETLRTYEVLARAYTAGIRCER